MALRRVLMEEVAAAYSEAKPVLSHPSSSLVGVYVGCMYHEYLDVTAKQGGPLPALSFVGNGAPYMVGRLSYSFGFTGPCVSTDTACSSSLVGLHLAHTALLGGEAQASVAGGINIMLDPATTAGICQLQVQHFCSI